MIEVRGNLFDFMGLVNWLCITTNGDVKADGTAVMGRGCALEAKIMFPGIDKRLGTCLKERGNVPYVLLTQYPTCVWSFPVKRHWGEKANLGLIEHSALYLLDQAQNADYEILIPRPGCGNGGLDWEKEVKPVLAPILDSRFKIITNV